MNTNFYLKLIINDVCSINDEILMKTFQRTETGVNGVDGEGVLNPAGRPDIEIAMTLSPRKASN